MPELMPEQPAAPLPAPAPAAQPAPSEVPKNDLSFALLRRAWRLCIGAGGVRLEQAGRGRRYRCVLAELPLATPGPGGVKDTLCRLFAALPCRFRAVQIELDDQWLRLFMVTPPHNARQTRDLQAAAAMRLATLYGGAAEAWAIQADWDAQRDFLACAIPQDLLADLRAVAQQYRLTLLDIVPAFVAHWNQRPRDAVTQGWFASADAAQLTLGILQQGRLQALRPIPLPPGSAQDGGWLRRELQRQAQLLGVDMPLVLTCCGTPPASWGMQPCAQADRYQLALAAPAASGAAPATEQGQSERPGKRAPIVLDFAPQSLLRHLRQMPGAGWCLAALGLLLCGASLLMLLDLQQQAATLAAQTAQIEQQRLLYRAARARNTAVAIAPARAEAVNAAIRQLNLPWRDLFDALEAAGTAPVALLRLDPDAGKQVLKAQAEAANDAHMLAYIEQLKAQPFFSEVLLTRHEIKARDPQQPIAFQFEARWRGEQP